MKITLSACLTGLSVFLAGCGLMPVDQSPAPTAYVCPTEAACTPTPTYEVSWDTWCAGSCNAYPVSHRSPTLACDDRRVEYRGAPVSACNRR